MNTLEFLQNSALVFSYKGKEKRAYTLSDAITALSFTLSSPLVTQSKVVTNATERLGLSLENSVGFAVVDADTGKSWMLVDGGTPSVSGDWLQLGDRDILAADITDSTAAGRALITAADAAAQRSLLAGTDPRSISGLAAGYRYADATINAGLVDQWNDCSGNGYHATAVSTKSTAATGYATGGARYIVSGSGIPTNWRSVTIVAIYNGGRRTSNGASSGCFVMTSGATGGAIHLDGSHHFYGPEVDAGFDMEQSGANLLAYVHGSTSRQVWQNWNKSTASVGTASSDPITHIWGWAAGTFTTTKERVALYIYNRALTESEIQSIAKFHEVQKVNRTVHFIADSFGVGVSLTSSMDTYSRLAEYATENAFAGCTTSSATFATYNMATWIASIQSAVDSGKRPIVVMDLGKNDLAANGAVATLKTNYQTWCEAAIAVGAKVVAVTLPPRNAGFTGITAANYDIARLEINTWLRTQTFFSALADIASESTIGDAADADNTTYYSDKIHLTAAGNAVYAKRVIRAINSL